jgi:hypothetical protein
MRSTGTPRRVNNVGWGTKGSGSSGLWLARPEPVCCLLPVSDFPLFQAQAARDMRAS